MATFTANLSQIIRNPAMGYGSQITGRECSELMRLHEVLLGRDLTYIEALVTDLLAKNRSVSPDEWNNLYFLESKTPKPPPPPAAPVIMTEGSVVEAEDRSN